jgi:hypothetical protein
MSCVHEGISILEMKPSKYKFFKKRGKDYIFINPQGIEEIWKKVHFSKPGFVLKYNHMLFESPTIRSEAI